MNKGIIGALTGIVGAAAGAAVAGRVVGKNTEQYKMLSGKHFDLFMLMNQWVKVKQENKSIAEWLEKRGIHTVAIYGMNYVGETLLNELKGSNISVKYGIDKNASQIYAEVDVYSPDETLETVDAVIVTAITYFDEISRNLESKFECPILSIEDILYEV